MRTRLRSTPVFLYVGAAIALLAMATIALNAAGGSNGFSLSSVDPAWAYAAVFALVLGDAICPVLPGETTLNAASTLAAQGSLDLPITMIVGALGAVAGDSCLYWAARIGGKRIQPQVEKASKNEKVALALDYLGDNAPVLIVAGRYVPGLRFVVNATMGISEFPYRRFLLWSALGGGLWSLYTCGLAYSISTALAGFPLASVIISSGVTLGAIGLLTFLLRRSRTAVDGTGRQA